MNSKKVYATKAWEILQISNESATFKRVETRSPYSNVRIYEDEIIGEFNAQIHDIDNESLP